MFIHPAHALSVEERAQLARSYAGDSVANKFFSLPRRRILARPAEEEGEEADEDEDEEDEEEEEESVQLPRKSVRVVSDQKDHQWGNRYGEKTDRLKMMLKKLVVQYRIDSLVDVPCRAHMHWMGDVVRELAKRQDAATFKYVCVDSRRDVLKEIKNKMATEGGLHGKVNMRFIVKRFWKDQLPKADMVLSWNGLDNMNIDNVRHYVNTLANTQAKLVLLGSHSGKLHDQHLIKQFCAGGTPIDFRKPPFALNRPMRIIANVSAAGNDKQMYIYRPRDMFAPSAE